MADYDPSDRAAAFRVGLELAAKGRMAAGLVYRGENAPYEAAWHGGDEAPPARQDIEPARHAESYQAILDGYAL